MSKNDEKIKTLIAAVEKQKKDMGKRPRVSFETNGLFTTAEGKRLNLNTVGDSQVLVEQLASLLVAEVFNGQAAEMLGLEAPPITRANYSVADWTGDFKQQIKLLDFRVKKKKLDKLNEKLGKLMSEDARTANELDNIEKLLG